MKFTDSQGREWNIVVNVDVVKRLKRDDGFDFMTLAENKFAKYLRLQEDSVEFTTLLWLLLKDQAKAAGVIEQDFDTFDGATLDSAWEAFAQAYQNFTRNKKIRSFLQQHQERTEKMAERVGKLTTERMEAAERLMIEQIQDQLSDEKISEILGRTFSTRLKLGETSNGAPAGSVATPAPSLSANSS